MNPFTRFLNQWSTNRKLDAFIHHWDRLENVVVSVYRRKMSLAEARPIYEQSWPWLRQRYPDWEEALRPYWQQTKAAGAPTQVDPFQMLIDLPGLEAIFDNWPVMQHLPAAREALNQYVIDQGDAGL